MQTNNVALNERRQNMALIDFFNFCFSPPEKFKHEVQEPLLDSENCHVIIDLPSLLHVSLKLKKILFNILTFDL